MLHLKVASVEVQRHNPPDPDKTPIIEPGVSRKSNMSLKNEN